MLNLTLTLQTEGTASFEAIHLLVSAHRKASELKQLLLPLSLKLGGLDIDKQSLDHILLQGHHQAVLESTEKPDVWPFSHESLHFFGDLKTYYPLLQSDIEICGQSCSFREERRGRTFFDRTVSEAHDVKLKGLHPSL